MIKGVFIMLLVFLVIAGINYILQWSLTLSQDQKNKYRKIGYYLIGLIYIVQGASQFFDKINFSWFSLIQILLGVGFICLIYLGKIKDNFYS